MGGNRGLGENGRKSKGVISGTIIYSTDRDVKMTVCILFRVLIDTSLRVSTPILI